MNPEQKRPAGTGRESKVQNESNNTNKSSFLHEWRDAVYSDRGPPESNTRHVLGSLSMFMDPHGRCYPGIPKIAERAAVSERTVRGHLNKAVRQGWIKRHLATERRGQAWRNYHYQATVPQNGAATDTARFVKGAVNGAEGAVNDDRRCGTNFRLTSKEQVKNKSLSGLSPNGNESWVSESACSLELAELFMKSARERIPTLRRPNLQCWQTDLVKLKEEAGVADVDIIATFRWALSNDFWSGKVTDPKGLRKHWDKLVVQREQERRDQQRKWGSYI